MSLNGGVWNWSVMFRLFVCHGCLFCQASIIWGVIGPARQFSKGQVYYGMWIDSSPRGLFSNCPVALTFFFLIGFLCPLGAWLLNFKYPNSWLRYVKCVSMPYYFRRLLILFVQLPCHFLRHWRHSARQRCQLCSLDHRWLHFPIRHPQASLFLVDEIQLFVPTNTIRFIALS